MASYSIAYQDRTQGGRG